MATAATIYAGLPHKDGILLGIIPASDTTFLDLAKTNPANTTSQEVYAISDITGNGRDAVAVSEAGLYNPPLLSTTGSGNQWEIIGGQNASFGNRYRHLKIIGTAFLPFITNYTMIAVYRSVTGNVGFSVGCVQPRLRLCQMASTGLNAMGTQIDPTAMGAWNETVGQSIFAKSVNYTPFSSSSQPLDSQQIAYMNGRRFEKYGYSEAGSTTASGDLYLLAGSDNGSNGVLGGLQAYFLFSGILTDTQMQQNCSYLSSVFTTVIESSDLPTYDSNLQFIWQGDSITYGQGVRNPSNYNAYSDLLTRSIKTLKGKEYKSFNFAIPGTSISTIRTNALTREAVFYDASKTNIWTVFAGTNDLAFNPAKTAQNVFDDLVLWCIARKAQGGKVVIWTILPRNSFANGQTLADFENKRLNVNTLIRDNYLSFADKIVDIGADNLMGQSGQYNTTYYHDQVHPSVSGYTRMNLVALPIYLLFLDRYKNKAKYTAGITMPFSGGIN